MASPVVVILVLSADAQSPTTQAMLTTSRAALAGAVVVVQEVALLPSDAQALKAGSAAHADSVVVVTWPDGGSRARLHVRVLAEPKWADRDLTFSSGDAPAERGRSAGLTLATMLPAEAPTPLATTGGPAAPSAPAPSATTPSGPTPSSTAAAASPGSAAPPGSTASSGPSRARASRSHLELDAAGLGTFGFFGAAGAGGGEVALRLVLPELVTFRLGGGVRFGEIEHQVESTELTTATTRVAGGIVVHAARVRALELGVEVDAAVVNHSVSHLGSDGTRHTQARALGAGGLLVDAAWWFDRIALFGAAGVELALGETRVYVGNESRAVIPRARGIVLLGVRLRL